MKTAMQELIDEMCSINWHLYSFNDKMKVVNVYLEKEKEQIINAHLEGWSDAYDYLDGTSLNARQAEDYYLETYNQNDTNERNNTDIDRVY
ncbi:MAG: hypothetical protein ACR2IM_00690 [Sediminibacterium sp.]